jgi:hypothetical protein
MADEDYFEGGGEQAMPEQRGDPEAKEAGDGGGETFAVNKTAYPDAKPGDTFKMRVVRVHDEDMECEVVKDDEAGEHEEPPAEAPMPAGDEMME